MVKSDDLGRECQPWKKHTNFAGKDRQRASSFGQKPSGWSIVKKRLQVGQNCQDYNYCHFFWKQFRKNPSRTKHRKKKNTGTAVRTISCLCYQMTKLHGGCGGSLEIFSDLIVDTWTLISIFRWQVSPFLGGNILNPQIHPMANLLLTSFRLFHSAKKHEDTNYLESSHSQQKWWKKSRSIS